MKLFNDGSIIDHDKRLFFAAVRAFYVESVAKALKKLPINDLVLNHAKFVNFEKHDNCTFDDVEYFCGSFHNLLNFTPAQTDKLQEEFTMYQLLDRSVIPDTIWQQALVREDGEGDDRKQYFRMDVIWAYLMGLKSNDGTLAFELLSRVAKVVLVIPHSNAGEEHVFSLIKSKIKLQSGVNGTLIQVKLANSATCIKWEPPKDLHTASKKATKIYNDMHKNK